MQRLQKSFSESGSSPPTTSTNLRFDLTPGNTAGIGHTIVPNGREFSFGDDWQEAAWAQLRERMSLQARGAV